MKFRLAHWEKGCNTGIGHLLMFHCANLLSFPRVLADLMSNFHNHNRDKIKFLKWYTSDFTKDLLQSLISQHVADYSPLILRGLLVLDDL